ncbi:dethiobiotin synthase [Aquirufa sp. ROCK-SH2]
MNRENQLVIAGIGTEIGKTVVSAILTKALKAHYWKPIQSGNIEDGDSFQVKKWVNEENLHIFPSTYELTQPLSPHTAAEIDGVEIDLEKFHLPQSEDPLIVELAGGIMVPLNSKHTNLDLLKKLGLPVVLVSKNYLGSINHTLLTFEQLKAKQIPIKGIIFNGPANPSGETFIENYTQLPVLLRIQQEPFINEEIIEKYAKQFQL